MQTTQVLPVAMLPQLKADQIAKFNLFKRSGQFGALCKPIRTIGSRLDRKKDQVE